MGSDMWKCPVCNTINKDNIYCKNCGLDQNRNYTAYVIAEADGWRSRTVWYLGGLCGMS